MKSATSLWVAATLFMSTSLTFAQLGTAPDFTVTDIDGNTHSLYADILDQGKIAVVQIAATWCPPCWNLHTTGALQQLHESNRDQFQSVRQR